MTTIYTVGHSTRSTEELVEILNDAGVGRIVDVRRFPGSRRHPHFAREALQQSLPNHGIEYDWRGEQLGGRRSRVKDRPTRHPAWRNAAFAGYADFMDTDEFRRSLDELERDAEEGSPIAIMCAETLWWKCHRRLISDALHLHGVDVIHLLGNGKSEKHKPNPDMRADEENRPVYDVGVTQQLL
jgi:uncharacterized protein (DUF488 family)